MQLTTTEKRFTLIFFLITILEIVCSNMHSIEHLRFYTKPLILISLIIYYFKMSSEIAKELRNFTLMALVFSLLGDVLLMFTHINANYFLSGLVAFLIAHVMYILVFRKQKNSDKPSLVFLIALLIYGALIFYVLGDRLADMLIPVVIYMLVILTMAFAASRRKGRVSLQSYNLVLIGALFFIISDSLIAINKFYTEVPLADILIMTTYAIAQYLIVLGLLKSNHIISNKS